MAVADTESTAFPANRIREAAQISLSEHLFRINPWGRGVEAGGRLGGALHQCTRITAFRASDAIQITKCPGKHLFHNTLLHMQIFARTLNSGLCLI